MLIRLNPDGIHVGVIHVTGRSRVRVAHQVNFPVVYRYRGTVGGVRRREHRFYVDSFAETRLVFNRDNSVQ